MASCASGTIETLCIRIGEATKDEAVAHYGDLTLYRPPPEEAGW